MEASRMGTEASGSPAKLDLSEMAIRRESASLFLFKKDEIEETKEDVIVREAERVENQKL
jgi:hypothetical protein